MGSGHFLVTAVDYLSDAIADLIEDAPTAAPWLEDAYTSPLLERIATIRADILARADAANWVIDRPQLTDQAIIRRMVLKRCIYGVDKNPLTVELAKGLPLAAQLHRRRAALLPRSSPALRRLAHRPARP